MADYRLTQSGDQVQEILNGAAMQSDLTAEQERAELAEQTLQNNIDAEALAREQADGVLDGKIDANTTRIVNIEGKIPSGASTENKLTTESEMNSAIATATATFRGTYNLVSDLGLAVSATHEQIATALAGEIATADNNDYCFVQVPTSESTPTQIAKIERYKFNGTAWAFEYELKNSGFTAEQWAAINSGITASQVAALPGMSQAIEAILVLIPSAASALNQLADKAFVNSSVSTNTATFRGTFNLITDLNLSLDATRAQIAAALLVAAPTSDNNDYAFVQIPTSAQTPTEISATERYKFNGTAWAYEYSLNTSGFTTQQWNAINSGITSALVTLLGQIIPSAATASNQLADKAYVLAQILAAIPSFKGQFTTLADLQAVASPKSGDLGIVRTKDSDGYDVFTFCQYLNSQWNVFYTLSHHLLRKPASTGTTGNYPYNGMGRVVIKKNMVNNANTLTQDAFEDGDGNPLTNTVFIIQYEFTIDTNITIPANCVLEFNGGSISGNYTLTGNNTVISGNTKNIFGVINTISGTWANTHTDSEMFDPNITDFGELINRLVILTAPDGKIDIRRNLTLSATSYYSVVTLNFAYIFDFNNTIVTAPPRASYDYKTYLFYSDVQGGVIRGLEIRNLRIEATANIERTYNTFIYYTSAVCLGYLCNVDGVLIENVKFNNCDEGVKFGYMSEQNDYGRKNVTFRNCYFKGVDPIYFFDGDNLIVENSEFDNFGACPYNHCFYITETNNIRLSNLIIKNSGVPFNIMNAAVGSLSTDVTNVEIDNITMYDCANVYTNQDLTNTIYGSAFAITGVNINIRNVRISATNTQQPATITNFKKCLNAKISNVYVDNTDNISLIIFSNSDCKYTTYSDIYIKDTLGRIHVASSDKTYLKNICFKNPENDSSTDTRIITEGQCGDIIADDCYFEINSNNLPWFIFSIVNANAEFRNCSIIYNGTLGGRTVHSIEYNHSPYKVKYINCYTKNLDFIVASRTDWNQPEVINCKNYYGNVQDFPKQKYANNATITDLITPYLTYGDAGYICYDTTNNKLIMWNGTSFIDV